MAISTRQTRPLPQRPSWWNGRTRWLLIFIGALLWSLAQAGLFDGRQLVNGGGWPQVVAFWQAAFQPTLTREFLAITLDATLVTLPRTDHARTPKSFEFIDAALGFLRR